VNDNLLKLLTRDLIDACGGLDLSAQATGLSVGQLSRCQNPNAPDFLNIKALYRLQRCAGRPIVSDALTKALSDPDTADVFEEVLDVVQAAGNALDAARRAKGDGEVTANERREIDQALNKLEAELREARAANAA
jgi:hypothetical protein